MLNQPTPEPLYIADVNERLIDMLAEEALKKIVREVEEEQKTEETK